MKRRTSNATSSHSRLSLKDVENIFIDKLQEKVDFTERGIAKIFNRFDLNGDGHLSVDEMAQAVRLYVNGVDIALINELVRHYDVDNDDRISLDEFSRFLLSRSSSNRADWLSIDSISTPKSTPKPINKDKERNAPLNDVSTSAPATSDPSTTVEYRARVFLKNMKSMLLKKASELGIREKTALPERLSYHYNEFLENQARLLVARDFKPYQLSSSGSTSINISSFKRVLSKYIYPGASPPRDDVYEHIFSCCLGSADKANPDLLIDLLFSKEFKQVNDFGFSKVIVPATEVGRPEVSRGPIVKRDGFPVEISEIPQRFLSARSRTGIAVPSHVDPRDIEKSSTLPDYNTMRNFAFGFNTHINGGNSLFSISKDVLFYSMAALGVIHDTKSNQQEYFEGHDDDICCLALSVDKRLAATGQIGRLSRVCVWETRLGETVSFPGNRSSNALKKSGVCVQCPGLVSVIGLGFFQRGVCAMDFSFDSVYLCAVGCDDRHEMGIWRISNGELIISASCGHGIPPLIRGIRWCPGFQNTAFVSSDSRGDLCDLICTVGEHHMKFWSFQRPDNTSTASLWNRGFVLGNNKKLAPPKVFQCVEYLIPNPVLSSNEKGSGVGTINNDALVLSGGDNGYLYVFRRGQCISSVSIFPTSLSSLASSMSGIKTSNSAVVKANGVLCVQVLGSLIVCGGIQGRLSCWDSQSWTCLQEYSLQPSNLSSSTSSSASSTSSSNITTASLTSSASRRPNSAGPRRASRDPRDSNPFVDPSNALLVSRSTAVAGQSSHQLASKDFHRLSSRPGKKPVANQSKREAWSLRPRETGLPVGTVGTSNILTLAIETEDGTPLTSLSSIYAATGYGRMMRIDSNSNLSTAFFYHYGPVWGLGCWSRTQSPDVTLPSLKRHSDAIVVTCGDDKWLNVWCTSQKKLKCRAMLPLPGRCIDLAVSQGGLLVAVGAVVGHLLVYNLLEDENQSSSSSLVSQPFHRGSEKLVNVNYSLQKLCSNHNSKEDISDVKFNSSVTVLAAGSHDNNIYL